MATVVTTSRRGGQIRRVPVPQAPPAGRPLTPAQAAALPAAFALALAALSLIPAARASAVASLSFWAASAALLTLDLALFLGARARGRRLFLDVSLRKQHYLQACAQGSVLAYWALYWPPLRDAAHLIVAQLLFALLQADPQLADYPIVLREGKGPLPDLTRAELYARACTQGWVSACQQVP